MFFRGSDLVMLCAISVKLYSAGPFGGGTRQRYCPSSFHIHRTPGPKLFGTAFSVSSRCVTLLVFLSVLHPMLSTFLLFLLLLHGWSSLIQTRKMASCSLTETCFESELDGLQEVL